MVNQFIPSTGVVPAGGEADPRLGQLLDGYRSYLKLIARVRLDGMGGMTDASDVVQEVFFRACRGFHQYRGTTEAELTAWLRRILAHCLVDHYRKHRPDLRRQLEPERLTAALDRSGVQWAAQLVSNVEAPSKIVQQREAMVLLADALEALEEDYRDAIVLRQLEELPMAEVARRMGRSIHSVRKLWARGMIELRVRLKELS